MKIRLYLLGFILAFVFWGQANLIFAQEKGCIEISGWLIYPEKDQSPMVKEMQSGKEKTFTLAAPDGGSIASMPVPELPKGYEFNFGECRLDDAMRNDIIAVVRHKDDSEWSTDVIKAWVADPETRSFRPIPVKGITCLNIGYGI